MRLMTSTTIAALLAAGMAAGAAAPALAQDRGPGTPGSEFALRGDGPGKGRFLIGHRRGGDRGLLAFVCSERGGDRLEHTLLSIAQRTDPTADQLPLYDAFASAAVAAQEDFATACDSVRPQDPDAGRPDPVERLAVRLAVTEAHAAALAAVLPSFEAFYDSLDNGQRQALERDHGAGDHRSLGFFERGAPEGAPETGEANPV